MNAEIGELLRRMDAGTTEERIEAVRRLREAARTDFALYPFLARRVADPEIGRKVALAFNDDVMNYDVDEVDEARPALAAAAAIIVLHLDIGDVEAFWYDVRDSLACIGIPAVEPLCKALADARSLVKRRAAETLTSLFECVQGIKSKPVALQEMCVAALTAVLLDPDPDLCREARNALDALDRWE